MYTVDYLINKRKSKWNNNKSIEKDKEFINTVAEYILQNEELIKELQLYPEKLIELFFYIVDKNKKSTPFFLNEVQREFVDKLNKCKNEYNEGKRLNIRMLINKGRQQGFTSFITAYQLASTIFNRNFEGFTCADEDGNTRAIFENKAKYPYSLLPVELKPSEKYNNAKQLLFDKIHSSWEVKTASKNMGRSRTINFWHGSEAAFWKDGISSIQAAIGEALTKDAIVILESTANGFNEYKELWDSGVWENCFFEWWKTEEYSFEFESKEKKEEFLYNIKNKNSWIWKRCKWLYNDIGLCLTKIYWYYNKYLNYIDKQMIKQEYPCTADEAFISTGECIFNTETLIQRKKVLEERYKKKPCKTGDFEIEWSYKEVNGEMRKNQILSYKWVDSVNGKITIYKDVEEGKPYCLGGDTSGDGSDFFVADIVDNVNGQQVAQLRHEFDEDVYAEQVYCLSQYYNDALVGIETNFSTYPIKRLYDLGCGNQYQRETEDSFTGKLKKSYGFHTNLKTRPLLIAELKTIVREHITWINSIETINEMLTFIKNEKGKPEAQEGKHDDCIMSLGISHYISDQQIDYIDIVKKRADYIEEDDEDYEEGGNWLV